MKFIWFCAAGYSFFYGIVLLIPAILFSVIAKHLWQKLLVYAFTLTGAFLVFLSATPVSWWFYIIWITSILMWFIFFALKKRTNQRISKLLIVMAFCLTITALLLELPFHLKQTMPKQKFETLYIIGDSVSAGIGGKNEQTWPKLLHDKYAIKIIDLSESGATVASAVQQAVQVKHGNAIVLLEVGGNDLFVSTAYRQFRKNLSQILTRVSNSNRMVVMLELPLLPWHTEYGRIQRQLAKQFNVILIPKRMFAGVLSVNGASTDLAHLSPKGHQLMAEKIWSILAGNFNLTAAGKK